MSWILYESKGSSKLNKICREILFQYCPFSKDIREKLRQHPVFQPHIERFDREMEESRKKAKNLESLLIRNKGKITEDLQKYFDYLEL